MQLNVCMQNIKNATTACCINGNACSNNSLRKNKVVNTNSDPEGDYPPDYNTVMSMPPPFEALSNQIKLNKATVLPGTNQPPIIGQSTDEHLS